MMKLRFAQPSAPGRPGQHPRPARHRAGRQRDPHRRDDHRERAAGSTLLAEKLPLLVEGARWIADPQVRYKGTIGGDICARRPRQRPPGADAGAGCVVRAEAARTASAWSRPTASSSACTSTLLEADEILTQIRIPIPAAGTRLVLQQAQAQDRRLRHRRDRRAAADEGRQASPRCRIALTNVGADAAARPAPPRQRLAGKAARRGRAGRGGAAGHGHLRSERPTSAATPDYKRAMCGEMTRRALLGRARARAKP